MGAIHVDLCKHGKTDTVIRLTKAKNVFMAAWFLTAKLIAWKSQYGKALRVILFVESLKVLKLWSEPTLRGRVDNQ